MTRRDVPITQGKCDACGRTLYDGEEVFDICEDHSYLCEDCFEEWKSEISTIYQAYFDPINYDPSCEPDYHRLED